jgi:hypothetical protein
MAKCKGFRNFKERGEWGAPLMAWAAFLSGAEILSIGKDRPIRVKLLTTLSKYFWKNVTVTPPDVI